MRRVLALGATLAAVISTLWAVTPAYATQPSTNGRLAFVAERHHIWQVFTMDPDGTHIVQVTYFTKPSHLVADVDWSPDGAKLAFTIYQSGDSDVWTISADGSDLTNVTNEPKAGDDGAHWSPDGTQLFFSRSSPRTGTKAVYRINADGTNMVRLSGSNFRDTEGPRLTPDASKVAFVAFGAAGGICEIWTMDPDGSDKTPLVDTSERLYLWDFTPDGTGLLVGDNCAGPMPQAIDSMNVDGTGLTRLTDPGCCSQDLAAAYSPDGKHIVFMSNRLHPGFSDGLPREIYEIDADGSNLVQITSSGLFSGLDWGPAP
jgi:Tol biopolymer transport system component